VAGDSPAGDGGDQQRQLPGIILGKELVKSLQVEVGDEINVVTPDGEMGPTGPLPRSRPFKVVGIFYTGMYEYDANYGYTSLQEARDFLSREGVSGVELKTDNVDHAVSVANQLQKELPESMNVLDWKEMNRSLFYALKLEKIAMFIVLTFIILVASFSIIAMLIMIVLEKKRDIAVLKSMGTTDGGVMRIFIYQGVVIGAVGAALGLVFGLTICYLLIEFGFPLNSEVYYIATLPVEINPVEIFLVVVCTIFISFVATIYPSRKAAKLRPVEGLRYE
jgi:lipoprotein-releasing system permease protein